MTTTQKTWRMERKQCLSYKNKRRKRKTRYREKQGRQCFLWDGINSDRQSVNNEEGEATTKVPNAFSNIPESVTRNGEKEVKKEEDQNQWNGING